MILLHALTYALTYAAEYASDGKNLYWWASYHLLLY